MVLLIKLLFAIILGLSIGLLYRLFKRPKQVQIKSTLESHYLHCSFGEVHYIQDGKGPDVVLLHGIGASHIAWKRLMLRMKKDYRLTAIDLPGFGMSEKNTKLDYGLDAPFGLLKAQRVLLNRLEQLNWVALDLLIIFSILDLRLHGSVAAIPE